MPSYAFNNIPNLMTSVSDLRSLLIETSGNTGYVGLAVGNQLVQQSMLATGRQHIRDLMPQCQQLCQQQGWKPADLQAIVVSTGPGSYTGLRVGIMTAKTLAYALNIPLIGVPTFDSLAWTAFQANPSLTSLTVIADGQQDKVYVQSLEHQSGDGPEQFQTTSPLSIVPGEAWRSSLVTGTVITGPGLVQQRKLLPARIEVLDESHWHPTLPGLVHIAMVRWQKQLFEDTFSLEPLYLRASSAEEQWAALGK